MLDLALFKRPAMLGVSLSTFALAASIFAMFLYITLYMQDVLGYGPLAAGLRFLPITLLAFFAAPISGKLTVRFQSRVLIGVALLLVAVGMLLMTSVHAGSSWTVLLPGFLVAGVGIGMANPVIASASVAVVPPQRSGMASGSSSTFRSVGLATGIAALGAVFQTQIHDKAFAALATTASGRQLVVHAGHALNTAFIEGAVRAVASATHSAAKSGVLLHAYHVGFTATLDDLMRIGAVVAFIGAVAAASLLRQSDFVPSHAPAPAVDA
jgi:predicted MFS family arabinose efflux permease